MSRLLAFSFAVLCLLLSGFAHAQDIIQFPLVTVTGTMDPSGSFGFVPSGGGLFTGAIDRGNDTDLAMGGKINPKANPLSPDLRCNPLAAASPLLKTTNYQSDSDTKFLAANTLFRFIYAQTGGNAMQATIGLLPRAIGVMQGGQNAMLWKTTWTDGSSSTHLIFPFLPPLFTDQQPATNGNSPPPADNPTACPAKGSSGGSTPQSMTPHQLF